MFQRLYDWTQRLAAHRHAMPAMAAISFAESSFFPIPPDVVVVPMILARRDQAWKIAAVCTIASVLGGIFGYAIGYFLYESLGQWLIRIYGLQQAAGEFHDWYAEWGAALIMVKGLTPIPYKVVAIASGLAKFNLPMFIFASAVTRGARFFIIAALLKRYGAPIQAFIEKRLTLVGIIVLVSLAAGFAVVALL